MAAKKKKASKRKSAKKSAHVKKFAEIASACQAEVTTTGKARAKAVGKCMKREFKEAKKED